MIKQCSANVIHPYLAHPLQFHLSLAIYLRASVPQFRRKEHQLNPRKKMAHWGQLSPKIWSLQAAASFTPFELSQRSTPT